MFKVWLVATLFWFSQLKNKKKKNTHRGEGGPTKESKHFTSLKNISHASIESQPPKAKKEIMQESIAS